MPPAGYAFDRAARAYADSFVAAVKKRKPASPIARARFALAQTAITPWEAEVELADGTRFTVDVTHRERAIPPNIDEDSRVLARWNAAHGRELAWHDLGRGLLCAAYYRELLGALRDAKAVLHVRGELAVWDEDRCGFDTRQLPARYDGEIKRALAELALPPAALAELAALLFVDDARRAALIALAPKVKSTTKAAWRGALLLLPRRREATVWLSLTRKGKALEVYSTAGESSTTRFASDAALVARADEIIAERVRAGFLLAGGEPADVLAYARAIERTTKTAFHIAIDDVDVTAAVERWAAGSKPQRALVTTLLSCHRDWVRHTPPLVEIADQAWHRLRDGQRYDFHYDKLAVDRAQLAALVAEGARWRRPKRFLAACHSLGRGKALRLGYV